MIYETVENDRVDIIAFDVYGNPFLVDDILTRYPFFCYFPLLPAGLEIELKDASDEV